MTKDASDAVEDVEPVLMEDMEPILIEDMEPVLVEIDPESMDSTVMDVDAMEDSGVTEDRIFVPPFILDEEEEVAVPDQGVDFRAEGDMEQQAESVGSRRPFPRNNKISRTQELVNAAKPITDAVQPLVDHVHSELSPDNIANRLQKAGETF